MKKKIINARPHNWLIVRIFQENFEEVAEKYLYGNLIDIGCGIKPYKELLAPFVNEHMGVDHKDSQHNQSNVDMFGTAYNIPVETASFDSAICTAVLEHLEEPELAIRECHRVLKHGGMAIYSVPFIWHIHEAPRDFYRYSKYGLKYLFEKTGFEVVELRPLSGFIATFSQLFLYYIKRYDKGILGRFRLISLTTAIVQNIAYKLNRKDTSSEWTWMYIIVAKKI